MLTGIFLIGIIAIVIYLKFVRTINRHYINENRIYQAVLHKRLESVEKIDSTS